MDNMSSVSIKRLNINTFIYICYDILLRGRAFILLPIYTRYLTPDEYGMFVLISNINNIIFYPPTFTMPAVNRFYFESKDVNYLRRLWGTNATLMTLATLFFTTFLLFVGKPIFENILTGIDFYPYIVLGLLTIMPRPLVEIYQLVLKTEQRAVDFAKIGIGLQVLNIVLIIMGLTVFRLKLEGILFATLISNIVGLIFVFCTFGRHIRWGFDREILKKSLHYSVQFIPHSLSGSIQSVLDKILLSNLRSSFDTGIYNIGMSFGLILNTITAGFNESFSPFFMSKIKETGGKAEIVKVASFAVLTYVIAGIGIAIFANDVIQLLTTPKYYSAWMIVPIVVLSNIFEGIYRILVAPLFYNLSGPKFLSSISLLSICTNIILCYFFISAWGMFGGALTGLVVNIVYVFIVALVAFRLERVEWETGRMARVLFVGILITCAIIYMDTLLVYKYKLVVKFAMYSISLYLLIIIYGYHDVKKVFIYVLSNLRQNKKA